MTELEKAARQALEALEYLPEMRGIEEAITALRQALEQPAQEPAATVISESGNPNVSMSWWHEPALPVGTPLYTRHQAREPLTDDRVWLEYMQLWPFRPNDEPTLAKDILRFARAIEAAHGIKGDA